MIEPLLSICGPSTEATAFPRLVWIASGAGVGGGSDDDDDDDASDKAGDGDADSGGPGGEAGDDAADDGEDAHDVECADVGGGVASDEAGNRDFKQEYGNVLVRPKPTAGAWR